MRYICLSQIIHVLGLKIYLLIFRFDNNFKNKYYPLKLSKDYYKSCLLHSLYINKKESKKKKKEEGGMRFNTERTDPVCGYKSNKHLKEVVP